VLRTTRDIGLNALSQTLKSVLCRLPDIISIERPLQLRRSRKCGSPRLLRFTDELVLALILPAPFLAALFVFCALYRIVAP